MSENIPERNWNMTAVGAFSVVLIVLGYLTYMVSSIPVKEPVIFAAVAGILFAVSSKTRDLDRLKMLMKPLSGFLGMVAGALLLGSIILFMTSSLEIALQAISQFEGESILGLIRSVFLPLIGYKVMLLGVFISATGALSVFWDRVDESVPVGAKRSDFLFAGILALLAVIGVFGTAFLNNISPLTYYQTVKGFLLSSAGLSSAIAGVLIFITYRAVRLAWKTLPIRESVSRSGRETYDKLKKPEKITRLLLIPVLSLAVALQGFLDIAYLNLLAPLTSVAVRTVFLYLILMSLTAYLGAKLLKLLTAGRDRIEKLIPYILFGATAYILSGFLSVYVNGIIAELPPVASEFMNPLVQAVGQTQVVMVLMTVAAVSAVSLKIGMNFLKSLGLVPRGLQGTTLAATGIFFSTLGVFLYIPTPVILFLGVAVSMICWEIGKESVVLGREIGRKGTTYRSELINVFFKLVTGIIAVLVARTALIAVENIGFSAPSGSPGVLVFLLSILGIGLLVFSLKEFT